MGKWVKSPGVTRVYACELLISLVCCWVGGKNGKNANVIFSLASGVMKRGKLGNTGTKWRF